MKKSGINPRTGQPYKRGGAYSKDKQDPTKQALKIAEAAAKEVEKKANDKETISKLRSEVASLEAQLTAEKASKEMAVSAAKLEVEQRLAMSLLQRYRDGLRDGASLSRGRGMGADPARATPDSAGMATDESPFSQF